MRGGVRRRVRAVVTDEIRATIIDHVINHGLSLREAGERVQPNTIDYSNKQWYSFTVIATVNWTVQLDS